MAHLAPMIEIIHPVSVNYCFSLFKNLIFYRLFSILDDEDDYCDTSDIINDTVKTKCLKFFFYILTQFSYFHFNYIKSSNI